MVFSILYHPFAISFSTDAGFSSHLQFLSSNTRRQGISRSERALFDPLFQNKISEEVTKTLRMKYEGYDTPNTTSCLAIQGLDPYQGIVKSVLGQYALGYWDVHTVPHGFCAGTCNNRNGKPLGLLFTHKTLISARVLSR